MPAKTTRGQVLEEALHLTEGDRNRTYGDPRPNMECFAKMLKAYLVGKAGKDGFFAIGPHDGAVICALLKISRIAVSPDHKDNWTDLAGYAAIGWECVEGDEDE